MPWTFVDQHTFNSDKLVRYAIYSLLRQLKLSSVLSICPAWTTVTAYLLAFHRSLLTYCKKLRTQLHNLSAWPKKMTMSNPCSHYTGVWNRAWMQYKISMLCLNVITGTGPQYFSELLHLYTPSRDLCSSADTFSKFLVLVPKHLARDNSHMSVLLPWMTYHTVSAILTLRHRLDRLGKLVSLKKDF